MSTKHYYAMHTPYGDAVDTNGTPIGSVFMFSKKRQRDAWVEDNYFNAYNSKDRQAKAITEHHARVTMLRQCGRDMYEAHERDRLKGSYSDYREYAQYCPTALMYDDYCKVISYGD